MKCGGKYAYTKGTYGTLFNIAKYSQNKRENVYMHVKEHLTKSNVLDYLSPL